MDVSLSWGRYMLQFTVSRVLSNNWEVCRMLAVVVGLPNWQRSNRLRGIGNINGG
jgi:hypothetical protein